jgi:hypothetical protein
LVTSAADAGAAVPSATEPPADVLADDEQEAEGESAP